MADSENVSGRLDEVAGGAEVGAETENKYTPNTEKRKGIALCLSGGGFRAAIFHLGALRRLNELGILSQIDTITSVSGGSIISAHLANEIAAGPDKASVLDNWEDRIAIGFRKFVQRDIVTLAGLKGWLPWNWWRSKVGVEALAARYYKGLTKLDMAELPARPLFVFCATVLIYGGNWEMSQEQFGDYQAGYAKERPELNVATAVAASSSASSGSS